MITETQAGMTVLVVEDEQSLADLYTTWLDDTYTVRTAYDGEEALDLIDETVDIVVLDRRLPALSGDEVLERIRDQGYDCRVVMLSAVIPDFDVIEMGFDTYLVKPVRKDDLHEVVDQMRRRATHDEQFQQFYALTSKKAVLEAEKSQRELEESSEFAALEAELADIKTSLQNTMADFENEDFKVTLQNLSENPDLEP